ncbi:MAG: S-layer homology domain-containing protein [Rivularia sp. ALOHA_DT_140]|nr:S-layer homology domain-containing protein [Rivularia sp. ALOHA_DT_140]
MGSIGNEAEKGKGIAINGSGKHLSRIFASQNVTIVLNNAAQLRGVTVTNSASRGTAVWIESASPTVANCTFINCQREGVFITGNANPKIKDNIFTQNLANGISITKNSRGEIKGNSCFQTGFGISIGDSATSIVIDNKIYDNHSGVVVSGDARPFLRQNICENNIQDGLTVVANALPDIGNNNSPGNNVFRDNAQFDIQNASINKLISVDNQVELQSVNGNIQFFADPEPEPEPEPEPQSIPIPEATQQPKTQAKISNLTDISEHWAAEFIRELIKLEIVKGFPNRTFRPDATITRSQYAALMVQAFNPIALQESIKFEDVKENYWGYQAIQQAFQSKLLSGYPGKKFLPNQNIPRIQVIVSLINALGLTNEIEFDLNIYDDSNQIPNYGGDEVAAATQNKLIVNYPKIEKLNPNRAATRAEVAVMVYQTLVLIGQAKAIDSPYVIG